MLENTYAILDKMLGITQEKILRFIKLILGIIIKLNMLIFLFITWICLMPIVQNSFPFLGGLYAISFIIMYISIFIRYILGARL